MPSQDQETSPAIHIQQLSQIDKDVVQLITSAGQAIRALTPQISPSDTSPTKRTEIESSSIPERKETFSRAATQYFSLLSTIDVSLRKQILALEHAQILPSQTSPDPNTLESNEKKEKERIATDALAPSTMVKAVSTAGQGGQSGSGTGVLDVGMLNARGDTVGRQMDAELWESAQQLLDRFRLRGAADGNANNGRENGNDEKEEVKRGDAEETVEDEKGKEEESEMDLDSDGS